MGLLDLLKKYFDGPSALVEPANAGGGPFHIVGDENHLGLFTVYFDPSDDPSHTLWIIVL